MRDVEVGEHVRLTSHRPARSMPRYIMGAVGGSVALAGAFVYAPLTQASAETVVAPAADLTVLRTRAPTPVAPQVGTAGERFGAPPAPGPVEVAPRSRFGVAYSFGFRVHQRRGPRGMEVVEGGLTSRRGVPGAFMPAVPDASDAFMNIGVQAAMQNTGLSYTPAVRRLEAALAKAKACVAAPGPRHACAVSFGGVTFDYGSASFSVRVRPRSALGTERPMPPGYGELVAFEDQDGMVEGSSFNRAAAAE